MWMMPLHLHVNQKSDYDDMGLDLKKPVLIRGFGNNKGADQPVHMCSKISTFVIRFLESIICKLATGEISIF